MKRLIPYNFTKYIFRYLKQTQGIIDEPSESLRERLECINPCWLKRSIFRVFRWFRGIVYSYYNCPVCNEEMPEDYGDGAPVEYVDFYRYGEYGIGEGWTERWTCPCCGEIFEFDNGNY